MDERANSERAVLPTHVINIMWQYAPENQSHLIEQQKHLSTLCSSGLITMVDREGILPGSPRDLTRHIEQADMIISLISSHLLSSANGYGIDMRHILEKHQDRKIYVLPLYIGSCPYHHAPIGQLPLITAKGRPFTHWYGDDRQKAYALAAEEIRKIVEILLTLKWLATAEDLYEQNFYNLALKACEKTLHIELARACEALAEQEKQKWLQRRNEANITARKLKFRSKQMRQRRI